VKVVVSCEETGFTWAQPQQQTVWGIQ